MQLHTQTHTHRQHALFSFPHLEHTYSHLMEKEVATHSSVLAWKIPWTEETGRPPSVESQSDTAEHIYTFTREPTNAPFKPLTSRSHPLSL